MRYKEMQKIKRILFFITIIINTNNIFKLLNILKKKIRIYWYKYIIYYNKNKKIRIISTIKKYFNNKNK